MGDRPPEQTYLLAGRWDGQQIVSVHVKCTYKLNADGTCGAPDEPRPLILGPIEGKEGEAPFCDGDVVPFKIGTDVVVLGTAHGHGRATLTAGVRVGGVDMRYLVTGPRKAIYRGRGSFGFSRPEVFDKIPVRYENAYGGVDMTAPDQPVEHVEDLLRFHPGEYPRNTVGRGYVVYENKEAIDGLELPNVEYPGNPLRPDNLVTGGPDLWWKQPLAWSCDFFERGWYPRVFHMGGIPDGLPEDDRQLAEVQLGWVEPMQRSRRAKLEGTGIHMDPRFANAASPGLVLPTMRGNETVVLTELSSLSTMSVRLPDARPNVRIRYRGRMHEVPVVPHRIVISTDDMGVYVVWHAAWPTPVGLPARPPRDGDPPTLGLEGIDVVVDGKLILPLDHVPPQAAVPEST